MDTQSGWACNRLKVAAQDQECETLWKGQWCYQSPAMCSSALSLFCCQKNAQRNSCCKQLCHPAVILCRVSVTLRVCSQGWGSWSHNFMRWSFVPGGQHLCKVGCFFLYESIIPSGICLGCHKLTLGQDFLSPQRPSKTQQSVAAFEKRAAHSHFMPDLA